ncbi:MAG: class I SAM-dependent methyltransferase [Chloroflexi bacterium]|jgi:SAM-dependent methyltransferase|nr:class I SAM-dependent methyltransferase [Anaerolineaceae bacterium]NLI45256.1 class I SAM-dependent methyltransferase [Chloroflexota bacterium]HOE34383.1 class I SAM-dependent methyltransferase [Anaerolineaceae bacterium]HQK02935.1 class I SAM-dependent methyltransferase [Anaerolineaceae bacterium]HQL28304.1 class I SAM-dependent methyltransferase [Anaerolineaceae bacterium]
MTEKDIKQEIGRFYNEVGWQVEEDGNFQNAQYEDLRPVSAEYIARAHARVARHLPKSGRFLLDAGSGPVQYDAYLQYSAGYEKRVCLDLSFVALKQAKARLGGHAWCVVADIANLPFRPEAFDGIVSLHTIHHLPAEEKPGCYLGLYERLTPGGAMVTVDGWSEHKLKKTWTRLIRLAEKLRRVPARKQPESTPAKPTGSKPAGTYVVKNSADWFKATVGSRLPARILTWRSVSVHFLRTVIQPEWGGKFWLRVLYRLEEWFPRYFGENGQYPLIVIKKPEN